MGNIHNLIINSNCHKEFFTLCPFPVSSLISRYSEDHLLAIQIHPDLVENKNETSTICMMRCEGVRRADREGKRNEMKMEIVMKTFIIVGMKKRDADDGRE